MRQKYYILDTNVLIQNPNALYAFDDNHVILVDVVLSELDRHKTKEGDIGYSAREVMRIIHKMRTQGDLLNGVYTPGGGKLFVYPYQEKYAEYMKDSWDKKKPDNMILATAAHFMNHEIGADEYVAIVTKDTNMLLMADVIGVPAEDFRTERVSEDSATYTGRREIYVSAQTINNFYAQGKIPSSEVVSQIDIPLCMNEFVVMYDSSNPKHSALARCDGTMLVPLEYAKYTPFGLMPRNTGQRFALEALLQPADVAPLVILKGPAGTAKTLCALAAGLEHTVEKEQYKKVLLTRANVKMDEDIGYLKGDMDAKMTPLLAGAFDNLELLVDSNALKGFTKPPKIDRAETLDKIDELLDRGYIEMEALAYLRGRSLNNVYLIVDEAQNTTPRQILSIITRCGINGKIVLCGDPEQIDNPRLNSRTNGLVYACDRMRGSDKAWQVTFKDSECERSPLAQEAAERMKLK